MHDNRNKIRAKRMIQRCTLKKPKVAKISAKTSTMGPSTPLCKQNVSDKVVKNECTVELTDFVTESAKNISMLVSELDYLNKKTILVHSSPGTISSPKCFAQVYGPHPGF